MKPINTAKLDGLRKHNLPIDQYAITGSGPLGVRNLRKIGDIDIIVTPGLWDLLAEKYGIIDKNGVKKIVFPGGGIEAFREGSFYSAEKYADAPTVADRITNAEIIDGLPFESLDHFLYFKRKMNREKDLEDVRLIEAYLRAHQK